MSEEGRIAVDLANRMAEVCEGQPTVSVYLALSMMIGGTAARAERPDFVRCMELVTETALNEFHNTKRSN
jgi:hypothetical protein